MVWTRRSPDLSFQIVAHTKRNPEVPKFSVSAYKGKFGQFFKKTKYKILSRAENNTVWDNISVPCTQDYRFEFDGIISSTLETSLFPKLMVPHNWSLKGPLGMLTRSALFFSDIHRAWWSFFMWTVRAGICSPSLTTNPKYTSLLN